MAEKITWQAFAQGDTNTRQEQLAAVGQNVLRETAVFQQTSDMLTYHNQLSGLIYLLQTGYAHLHARYHQPRCCVHIARLLPRHRTNPLLGGIQEYLAHKGGSS